MTLVNRFSLWACLAVVLALSAPTGKAQSAATNSTAQGSKAPAKQRVILITGSTDGLGRAVALKLAASGTHIIVHGRNVQRGMEVVKQIEQKGGSAKFYRADLASLAEVRKFGETILHDYDRLDVLVHNAGVWLLPEEGRKLSPDGYELTFAVNYLSEFLLTYMLMPRIISSAPSRIVFVASMGQVPIDFNDVMLEHNCEDHPAYRRTKLAQIMFSFDLARELKGTSVTVVSLHPASMMDTHMVVSRGEPVRSTTEDGVQSVLHAVDGTDIVSGQFYNMLKPARANDQAYDEQARKKLRELSIKLTGIGSP